MRRSRIGAAVTLLTVVAACGSESAEPANTVDSICAAWTEMMDAQPTREFTDDEERAEAFTALADEVANAIPFFEGGAAETLEQYETAIRDYADRPDDEDAVEGLAEMIAPLSVVARGVAGICGVDVAEGR